MTWLTRGVRVLVTTVFLAACASEDDPIGGNLAPIGNGDAGAQGTPLDAGSPPLISNPTNPSNPNNPVVVVPGTDGGCGAVKAKTEPVKPPVDIVWAIDNSGSMGSHIAAVMNNMVTFMNGVRMSGGNIEVVLMTTPSPESLFQHAQLLGTPNYHWLAVNVQSHDAFRQILANYDAANNWKQFLRPNAPLHIVAVTDDSSDMPSADFLAQMKSKLGGKEFIFHAVGATGSGTDCMGSFPGLGSKDYFDAAKATGGQSLVLCKPWIDAMKTLQTSVVATVPPLPCDYAIPAAPNGQKLDPAAVQVVYTPTGGTDREFALASTADKCADNVAWHFDDANAPSKVIMCPKACETVKAGGGISIGFGCAPSVILF